VSIDLLQVMARNNALANHRLSIAFGRLRPGEFQAARTGFFPSIAETANHILQVDLYYLGALEGHGNEDHDAFTPATSAAELAPRQAATDARLVAFCRNLTPARLARETATDRGADGIVMERTDALLVHLFMHQVHHRGQIHAMLSGTTVPPPQLDEFILRYDRGREDFAALGFDDSD
jgi:uncharacterized damage-inducible protein DinB